MTTASISMSQWFVDVSAVSSALANFRPAGRVLEFACGTGILTEQLLPFASQLTALDGSSEMLAINASRLRSSSVRYIEAGVVRIGRLNNDDIEAEFTLQPRRPLFIGKENIGRASIRLNHICFAQPFGLERRRGRQRQIGWEWFDRGCLRLTNRLGACL